VIYLYILASAGEQVWQELLFFDTSNSLTTMTSLPGSFPDANQARTSEPHHEFTCSGAKRPNKQKQEKDTDAHPTLTNLWLGLAVEKLDDGRVKLGFACHDGTYTMDFAVDVLTKNTDSYSIEYHLIDRVGSYAKQNAYRYVGVGVAEQVVELCPYLLSRLWAELDIVPIIVKAESGRQDVDEVADSMARKCIM
jgi:hypothetical protein